MYCPGSAPTYTTGRNQCRLMEKHPGRLTLSMVLLKGLSTLLFILYVSRLFTIVERHLAEVHAYADDTQPYIAFKPEPEHATNAVAAMQACITDIRKGMLMDKMMLNVEKTEFIVIGTRQ